MALLRSRSADKNIVDRTNARRNSDVARTVRATREALSQRAGNPAFDRELLKLHGRAVINSAVAIPLLVLIIAVGGFTLGGGPQMARWALVSIICYMPLAIMANRVMNADAKTIDAKRTRALFLAAHAVSGIGWVWLVLLDCSACHFDNTQVLKAVLILLAMSATAIITQALSGATIATFALPVAAFTTAFFDISRPVELSMIVLLVAALPFFAFISTHLYNSTLALLAFKTEKDWLIAELETANSISDEARRRAEEANLAKSRFLASMSHELRTPLNAILGFSEVMMSEILGPIGNPIYRDYSADIHSSGRHLLEVINEILDLSRIEAGRYSLQDEFLSLPAVVEECCHMVALKARTKDIRLEQAFEAEMPTIRADERAIRQITLNLLANAIKFTPTGGTIRATVGWTAGGGQYLSIRDNGPGIPEDEIPVVLSAFGQGSIAIKTAEQGSGLGLPIVQGLVAIHDGEFQLRSKIREGTEAIAIFPRSRVSSITPPKGNVSEAA
ncbi:MAG: HAMP domain-containing sensor histidine kinase [Mesorhizobium sp.]